jgi:hypothetical protein
MPVMGVTTFARFFRAAGRDIHKNAPRTSGTRPSNSSTC